MEYRRLRSITTNRMLHQKKEPAEVRKPFDPTAWYVFGVKRNMEFVSRDFFNSPTRKLKDLATGTEYNAEAYLAVQVRQSKRKKTEKAIIRGKLFVRVDESHRVDVMKQCSLLTHCIVDRSASPSPTGIPHFARIPDAQIQKLRTMLENADGEVEFTEEIPRKPHERIVMLDDKRIESIVLDNIGSLRLIQPHP